MTWMNILKIIGIPSGKGTLIPILANRREFENTLNLLRESKEPQASLQGTIDSLKSQSYESLYEQSKNFFGEPTLTLEESKKMFEELKKLVEKRKKTVYLTSKDILSKIKDAIEEPNKEKAKKIYDEIVKNTPKYHRESKWWKELNKSKEIRVKLDYLKQILYPKSNLPFLSFENIQENTPNLVKFAELLDGNAENGVIYVKFKTFNDFVKKINEKDTKGNQPIKEFYNKNFENNKISWNEADSSKTIDASQFEITEMVAKDIKLQVIGDFNERSVENYLEIVGSLTGSVKKWKPSKLPNTSNPAPENIFLERGSGNNKSLILNPYASILINNDFTNENWFDLFFDSLRTQEIVSDNEVMIEITTLILNGIINNDDKIENIDLSPFIRDNRLQNLKEKSKFKDMRKRIREIINTNETVNTNIYNKKREIRESQLSAFQGGAFTLSEGNKIISALNTLGFDEIEVEYFDSINKILREEEKDQASYLKIKIYDEPIDYNSVEALIKDLEKNKEDSKIVADIKNIVSEDTKNIVSQLRNIVTKTPDFVSYVLDLAKKKQLNSIITTYTTSASYLEQINPKNSLVFLSILSENALSDEVGEVFNKVASKPDDEDSLKALQKLNKEMPSILTKMKKSLIGSFELQLKDFAEKYISYPEQQIKPAIDKFKDKGMLRVVSNDN